MSEVSGFKRDALANLAGAMVMGITSLITVPILIQLVGLEEYALVGFYATVQSIFGLIDSGFASGLNRELAINTGRGDSSERLRTIVYSLELVYLLAALVGLVFMIAAGAGASWFPNSSIPQSQIKLSLAFMVVSVVFRMPIGFYSGGLLGVRQHVAVNVINSVAVTLTNTVSLGMVWLVSRSTEAYFATQCVGSAIQVLVLRHRLKSCLGAHEFRPHFDRKILNEIGPYIAGVCGITLLGALLKESDKLFLTRILSLREFAIYAIAVTLANSLFRITTPLYNTFFPRLSFLVGQKAQNTESEYMRYAQILGFGTIPVAAVICCFPREILMLWTRSAETAQEGAILVQILTISSVINSVMHLPYGLQLAHGWTSLTLKINISSLILTAGFYILLGPRLGSIGVALIVAGLSVGYLVITAPLVHRRLLNGALKRWYLLGVILPAIGAGAAVGLVWILRDHVPSLLVRLFIAAVAASIGCGALLPYIRNRAIAILQKTLWKGYPTTNSIPTQELAKRSDE